jgi:hypothetical protein
MAFKDTAKAQAQAATGTANNGGGRAKQEILGYLNLGLPTKTPGKHRRVDSVRLIKGNPIHEQVFAHLNLSKEGDNLEGMSDEEIKQLSVERINRLAEMLQLTFNPSPDEAESELAL